jgi:hypothetical protein
MIAFPEEVLQGTHLTFNQIVVMVRIADKCLVPPHRFDPWVVRDRAKFLAVRNRAIDHVEEVDKVPIWSMVHHQDIQTPDG